MCSVNFFSFSWCLDLINLQDGEAYAHLLTALAPELNSPDTFDTKDPTARATKILEQAEKLDCKKYLTAKDIIDGSPNLNLAFVAEIFQHRWAVVHIVFMLFKCADFLDYILCLCVLRRGLLYLHIGRNNAGFSEHCLLSFGKNNVPALTKNL